MTILRPQTIAMILVLLLSASLTKGAEEVAIQIHPDKIEGRINPHIYGFLMEHLYHSISNGLWGENVWNRSFEELRANGKWSSSSNGHLAINAQGDHAESLLYITPLANGRVSLDVKRRSFGGSILIGIRDQHREKLITNRIFLHLDSPEHNCHEIESRTGWIWYSPHATLSKQVTHSHEFRPSDWNHITVEAIDSHIIIFINDEKVFDDAIESCPKDGMVAIGAIDCDAEFKNIVVENSDRHPIESNLNLARHWNMIGDCKTSNYTDALNQDNAIQVDNTGRWAGIEQEGKYYVRKDDAQKGSIFLKGNVQTIDVQFVLQSTVLSSQTIQGITEDWKEYPLTLSVNQDAHDASLRILTHDTGTFMVDQVSLMHTSSLAIGGFRKEMYQAVADVHPTMLRWPGGSFSEQYRFENGIGPQCQRRGIYRWDDFDPLSFGTDEFISFCHSIHAEPNIVVPIGYHNYEGYAPDKDGHEDWLQRALDWLEYCNGDTTTYWGKKRAMFGHPEPYGVKYWEIDNEVWKMDPKLYAQLARLFSIAMKKKDPTIKIIACGCGRLGAEGHGLDSIVISDIAPYVDYISPHYYQTIDKYGNDGIAEYGAYLDRLAQWISQSSNPQMGIYLSEWNLDGIDMRTGLFCGGFLNRLERTPNLQMAAPALFLRHISAPGWNNAFINFDQDRWFAAPNYVIMKLWREHYLPNRIEVLGDPQDLNLMATVSDDSDTICLKIVNPTSQDIPLHIHRLPSYSPYQWEVVAADSLSQQNSLAATAAVRVARQDVGYDAKKRLSITVPHYSASVITWCRRKNSTPHNK